MINGQVTISLSDYENLISERNQSKSIFKANQILDSVYIEFTAYGATIINDIMSQFSETHQTNPVKEGSIAYYLPKKKEETKENSVNENNK
jgi:hypothetical protein